MKSKTELTLAKIKPDDFTSMHLVLPVGTSGNFGIKQQLITKDDVKKANIQVIFNPYFYPPKEGTATILYKKSDRSWKDHDVIMSDTEYEKQTNLYPMRVAGGNVLIAGLGLGMIILPMLKRKNVKKIVVVEKEQDVINLVYRHIKKFDNQNKLEIIHDDIFNVDFPKGTKFDVLYFDIWNNVCGDNYSQMKELRKKFRKFRARPSTMECWEEDRTKYLDREP